MTPPAATWVAVSEVVCVGCGCTDAMACPDGCAWLWINYELGEGLCTTCGPEVEACPWP